MKNMSCLSVVLAPPTPSPPQGYDPEIGQTNAGGYGVNKDPYCHMVEKVAFENQCKPYTETTCHTQNKEAVVFLRKNKVWADVDKVYAARRMRAGKAKLRNRRRVQNVFNNDVYYGVKEEDGHSEDNNDVPKDVINQERRKEQGKIDKPMI